MGFAQAETLPSHIVAGQLRGCSVPASNHAALPMHCDSYQAAQEHGVLLMTSQYFGHHHPNWSGFRLNLCGSLDQARISIDRLLWRP